MIVKRKIEKRSVIWTTPIDELELIAKECTSISAILKRLGYGPTGGTHRILQERIKQDGIDISHIPQFGNKSNLGKKFNFLKTKEECLSIYFVKGENFVSNKTLIRYIREYSLIKSICQKCGNAGTWQNEPITLQLDHINGDRKNNQLDNLQFLCPNCHSQTCTFGARNRKKAPKKQYNCSVCNTLITQHSTSGMCIGCKNLHKGLIERKSLDKDEISKLVWELPLSTLAKQLKCTNSGLKKFCQRHGIKLPPRHYCIRRQLGHSHEESLLPLRHKGDKRITLSESQVREIRQLYSEQKWKILQIARKFNLNHQTIRAIVFRKTYRYYP